MYVEQEPTSSSSSSTSWPLAVLVAAWHSQLPLAVVAAWPSQLSMAVVAASRASTMSAAEEEPSVAASPFGGACSNEDPADRSPAEWPRANTHIKHR